MLKPFLDNSITTFRKFNVEFSCLILSFLVWFRIFLFEKLQNNFQKVQFRIFLFYFEFSCLKENNAQSTSQQLQNNFQKVKFWIFLFDFEFPCLKGRGVKNTLNNWPLKLKNNAQTISIYINFSNIKYFLGKYAPPPTSHLFWENWVKDFFDTKNYQKRGLKMGNLRS